MERAVVRDEEALCECLLLTSTTLVHGMKVTELSEFRFR